MDEQLLDLRKQIDAIDTQLLTLLAKRLEIVSAIGTLKKKHGVEIFDRNRWEAMLQERKEQAAFLHLDEETVAKLFMLIHDHAVAIEKEMA